MVKVFSDLAVAKTRKPLEANCKARALPAPPWEHLVAERLGLGIWRELDRVLTHPVIRIDRCFESDMLGEIRLIMKDIHHATPAMYTEVG